MQPDTVKRKISRSKPDRVFRQSLEGDNPDGKTASEMQAASTFLDAGWDFIDETASGTDDIWWILEVQNYPRLWWEASGQ